LPSRRARDCCLRAVSAGSARPTATAAGPPPPGPGSWSAHLLGGRHPHQREAAPDDLPDTKGQFQPRARKLWIVFKQEAPFGIVVAAIPKRVEFGCEIVEVKGDSVGL